MAATSLTATPAVGGGAFAETTGFNAAGLGPGDIARAPAMATAAGTAVRLLVRLAILIML